MGYRIFVAGAFALFAAPALADLTAEEVLADHLNLLSGYGLVEMTSTGTTETANGLSVAGLIGTYADDEAKIEIRYSGFELIEQADGSVRIDYPTRIPITIFADPAGEPPVEMTVALETSGLIHVASGTPDKLQHDFAFDRASVADIEISPPERAEGLDLDLVFEIEGAASTIRLDDTGTPKRDVSFELALLNVVMRAVMPTDVNFGNSETSYSASGSGDTDLVLRLANAAGAVSYEASDVPRHGLDVAFDSFSWTQTSVLPDDEGSLELAFAATEMTAAYDIALSIEAMERSFTEALAQGQGARGSHSFATLDYKFGIDSPEGGFFGSSSSGATDGRFSFDRGGFTYTGNSAGTTAEIAGAIPEFPLSSISYSIAAADFDMAMPLMPSEVAQPFRLAFGIEGLRTGDELWDLFDPGQALPRDPLDMAIDIEGTTIVEGDLFAEAVSPPLRQTEARLNALKFSVAGTELTGDGSVIDTSTAETPSGVGELNLVLVGGNTLLDSLVAIGLLPNEQAMAARMTLGLFARPGDGPDTLVSTIELKEDGTILANGQRIK